MTDIDLTKACADAIDLDYIERDHELLYRVGTERDARTKEAIYRAGYDPLHDDAQAMSLLKRFNLMVNWNSPTAVWCMPMDVQKYGYKSDSADYSELNRAICECVAQLARPNN